MNTTTITRVVKKWKDEFEDSPYKFVFSNNEIIWMIFDKKTTIMMQNSWILDQIREEMWEWEDEETKKLILKYQKWDYSSSIWFDNFIKKYEL